MVSSGRLVVVGVVLYLVAADVMGWTRWAGAHLPVDPQGGSTTHVTCSQIIDTAFVKKKQNSSAWWLVAPDQKALGYRRGQL
jgi:hypothetical protein